jgi:hypothetical protein
MKKIIHHLIFSLLIFSIVFLAPNPVTGQTNYEVSYSDPVTDVKEFGDSEPINASGFDDIDIVSVSSNKALIKQDVIFKIKVAGIIEMEDSIVYGVYILNGDTEKYLALFSNGTCFGYSMDSMDPTGELLLTSGEKTDTLQIIVPIKNFGILSDFDFYAFASEFIEINDFPYEYLDYAPDQDLEPDWSNWEDFIEKVLFIKAPINGSTVNQVCTVEGYTDDQVDSIESVEIQIDTNTVNGWKQTTSNNDWASWNYQWDSREVSDGKHVIRTRAFNGDGYFYDNITVFVDQTSVTDPETSEAPKLKTGDKYEYNLFNYLTTNPELEGATIIGSMGLFVSEITTLTIDGTKYDVYSIKNSGEIKIINEGYTTVTEMEGDLWLRVSDLAVVQEETLVTSKVVGSGMEETTIHKEINVYEPPINKFKFPLTVSDDWQTNVENTMEIIPDEDSGEKPYTDTEVVNYEFECLRTETIVVPYGTFETFLIHVTVSTDPTINNDYSIEYYSPELGYIVKTETYDENRQLLMSYELVSYEQGSGKTEPDPSGDSFELLPGMAVSMELCFILLIVAAILIISIILILRRRRDMDDELLSQYSSKDLPAEQTKHAPGRQVHVHTKHKTKEQQYTLGYKKEQTLRHDRARKNTSTKIRQLQSSTSAPIQSARTIKTDIHYKRKDE